MSLDFLAIGDIVTEPFIRLKEAEAHCEKGAATCTLCMRWGDKIPYESATLAIAVGNASNAAVSAARLGLKTALRAYVGNDHYGAECLQVLKNERVATDYMVTEPGKKTNYHYVLWYQSERTILVKHEEFSYTAPKLLEPPKWVYLSSLAANSLDYHHELVAMLDRLPGTKLAFNPGTFQMKLGVEALHPLYERTEFFCVNREEAGRILGTDDIANVHELLRDLRALGPKLVVITDGTEGAYAYDGVRFMKVPMYPDTRGPFERTGAGDAFTSSVAAALCLGHSFEDALLWGPVNSMSVVQDVGAQKGLLTRDALEHYLQTAPSEYRITDF